MTDQLKLAQAFAKIAKETKGVAVVTEVKPLGQRLPRGVFTVICDDGAVCSVNVKRTVGPA